MFGYLVIDCAEIMLDIEWLDQRSRAAIERLTVALVIMRIIRFIGKRPKISGK